MVPLDPPILAVIGNGMVGLRFLEQAVELGLAERFRIVAFGDEAQPAYDRVHLSAFFDDDGGDLGLADEGWYAANGIELRLGARITSLDTAARTIVDDRGEVLRYEHCVLATGSYPFVPPIPGTDAAGVFVYRTIDDLEAMRAWATAGCSTAAVIGGGLLGLEAANAMRQLGLHTTVVELAPRLMAVQLDDGPARCCGARSRSSASRCGRAWGPPLCAPARTVGPSAWTSATTLRRSTSTSWCSQPASGRATSWLATPGSRSGARGVVVDDGLLTSDPAVHAIGEVACHAGRVHGLVAPGYEMATVVARRLAGDDAAVFAPTAPATKLKLLGIDVAVAGVSEGASAIVVDDPVSGTYRKLVLGEDGEVVGLVLVGDAAPFAALSGLALTGAPAPANAFDLLTGMADAGDAGTVCSCHNVTGSAIRSAICDGGLEDVGAIKACTKAGTGCGSCLPLLDRILGEELRAAGKEVSRGLCEHFGQTRQELFEVIRVTGIRSFAELAGRFGTGRGCAVCKPAVASMFASLSSGHILDGEQASLQDTNDHFLANIQRDGTYSVIPRIPGGEITADGLIAIGEVARDFDLYCKITGGQRVDLLGATVDQLPLIWPGSSTRASSPATPTARRCAR